MSVFTCGRFNHFAETLFIDSHSFGRLHFIFKIGTYIVQDRVKMLPIVVFFSMAAARIGFVYFESGAFTTYDYVMAVVEAGLAFILTLIFLQSLPIFTIKK